MIGRWLLLRREDVIWGVCLFVLVLGAPLLVKNSFYVNLMVLVWLFAGTASAWNILGGIAGQFSLGHTVFFGIGAFTSTMLYMYLGKSPWIGMLAGGCISMVLALLVAYPIFRLRGVFFAMATIAISETVRSFLIYGRRHLGLPFGLSIDYQPGLSRMIFEDRSSYALLTGGFLLLTLVVSFVLSRSYVGYCFRAIRDNDEAAAAAGIPIRRYKLLALLVSTFLTSIGGSLLAQYTLYIEPDTVFNISISVDLALMCIIGGIGTLLGPIVGAVIVYLLQEMLRGWLGGLAAGAYLAVYGVLLVIMVTLAPQGLVGGIISAQTRRRRRRSAAAVTRSEVDEVRS